MSEKDAKKGGKWTEASGVGKSGKYEGDLHSVGREKKNRRSGQRRQGVVVLNGEK